MSLSANPNHPPGLPPRSPSENVTPRGSLKNVTPPSKSPRASFGRGTPARSPRTSVLEDHNNNGSTNNSSPKKQRTPNLSPRTSVLEDNINNSGSPKKQRSPNRSPRASILDQDQFSNHTNSPKKSSASASRDVICFNFFLKTFFCFEFSSVI